MLTFASERLSAITYDEGGLRAPAAPPPLECPAFHVGARARFAQYYDMRLAGGARPLSGADCPNFLIWIRPFATAAGVESLVALADAPPPPVEALLTVSAPLGTMTWSFDVLGPADQFDWVLLSSKSERIHAGYATHTLQMWDESGRFLAAGRQTAALFA